MLHMLKSQNWYKYFTLGSGFLSGIFSSVQKKYRLKKSVTYKQTDRQTAVGIESLNYMSPMDYWHSTFQIFLIDIGKKWKECIF